ncbi:HAMP domain-containing histidine kinase [Clostridium sp. YB-6]|uniref:histidine kinase n=2 Tax=Clostridium weizhouense TaxID=2859781 RepID=A0ABS7AT50_9CLOT|nr:HAMP domain-containing histidine kinase [Clostridium weizhouense]
MEKDLIPLVSKKITVEEKLKGAELLRKYGITSKLNRDLFPNYTQNFGIIFSSVFFAIILLVFNYLQFSYFFNKIRKLTLAANKILDKEYSILINEDTEGDFAKLSIAFNKVRSIIRNNINTIEKEKIYLVEVLQNISHQLKTRLSTMLLYNDILLNRKLTEEQRQNFIEDNGKQLSKMNEIIHSILKLAKLDASAIEFYKKEHNLNKTIEEVVFTLKSFAAEKELEINLINNDSIDFLHDKLWIQEAITNIVKNAIDHTKPKGIIDISLINNPAYYRIIIKDTGEGIEQEEIVNIFKRFHKIKHSNKSDSVGIGLAISKSIIEGHNGYIDVKSEKGIGTSFNITFMKY